jgi:hypothetical protein
MPKSQNLAGSRNRKYTLEKSGSIRFCRRFTHGIGAREFQSNAFSAMKPSDPHFVVCVKNTDYPSSLELRKLYQVVSDRAAAKHHQIRVIDESGEDYLYPEGYFVPVQLPPSAEKAVLCAASLSPTK